MHAFMEKGYDSFAAFYSVYLSRHSNRVCRQLHFTGLTLALLCLAALFLTGNPWWLLASLACGYGFGWVSHAAFEKNQPTFFRHPFYSFLSAWMMYWQILTDQISF